MAIKRMTAREAEVCRPLCVMGLLITSCFLGLCLGTWGMALFGPMWLVTVVMTAFAFLPPRDAAAPPPAAATPQK